MDIGWAAIICAAVDANGSSTVDTFTVDLIGWGVAVILVIINVSFAVWNSYKIENLKAALSKEIINYEIKLKHLHERRIDAIAELYSKLVSADLRFKAYTSEVKRLPTDESERRKTEEYLAQEAHDSLYALRNYAEYAHIFFPKKIRKRLKEMVSTLFKYMVKYDIADTFKSRDSETISKMYQEVWDAVSSDIPVLKTVVEEEFRKMLGSDKSD